MWNLLRLRRFLIVGFCLCFDNLGQCLHQLGEAEGDGDVSDGGEPGRGDGDGAGVDKADDQKEVLSVCVRKQDVVGFARKCILLKIRNCSQYQLSRS